MDDWGDNNLTNSMAGINIKQDIGQVRLRGAARGIMIDSTKISSVGGIANGTVPLYNATANTNGINGNEKQSTGGNIVSAGFGNRSWPDREGPEKGHGGFGGGKGNRKKFDDQNASGSKGDHRGNIYIYNRGSAAGGAAGSPFVAGTNGPRTGGGIGQKNMPRRNYEVETPRGGGFGESYAGRSKNCFECGEEGHMSKECPNVGAGGDRASKGGGQTSGCFNCGKDGHISRDCPDKAGRGDGNSTRAKGCFNCGNEGHMSRDCPDKGGSGDGNSTRAKGCFNCGNEGHMSRDCPDKGGDGSKQKSGCFKCSEEGHFSRECPQAGGKPGEVRAPPYIPPPPSEEEEAIFQTIATGINFDKYDDIPVECTGREAPKQGMKSFEEAALSPAVMRNVQKAKYGKPTPIQKWSIPVILNDRDLMGCAQTGSGKTAAFLLPILTNLLKNGIEASGSGIISSSQEPMALVIAPTRELALQINNEARKFAHGTMVRSVVTYGGTSMRYQQEQVNRGAHVVVGTPGRLIDFINRGVIGLSKLRYLVLDEADRMLDLGFEPDMRRLVGQMGMPSKKDGRQTLMFSATFPAEIQKLAGEFLSDYIFVSVGAVGGANTDIEQVVLNVSRDQKKTKLFELLDARGNAKVLLFCGQKRMADFLATLLSQSEYPATSIHGDRTQKEREEAIVDFRRGTRSILIATSVAARGLDISGVDHVINYDLPDSVDEYVHRIGRTARCGNIGKATSFFDADFDSSIARALVKVLQDARQDVPNWLDAIASGAVGSGGFSGGPSGGFRSRDARRGAPCGSRGEGGGQFGRGGGHFGSEGPTRGHSADVAAMLQPIDVDDANEEWN